MRSSRPIIALVLQASLCVSQPALSQDQRGVVLEDERYNHLPIHPAYGTFESLPSNASIKKYFPPVVNQVKGENSAVAIAVTWFGLGAANKRVQPDQKIWLSPSFTYRDTQRGITHCQNPTSMIDALHSVTENGAPTLSYFGMFCVAKLDSAAFDSARQHRLSGYARLFNTYDSKEVKIQSMKRAIVAGNPAVVGFICPTSFKLVKDFWSPPEKPVIENGGHAVCISGYDDSKYGGAFEIVNGWGKEWGQGGYSWLRYDDVESFVLYGFEMFKMTQQINAEIRFETDARELMAVNSIGTGSYRFNRPYKVGEQFRIEITSPRPVFAGVKWMDQSGSGSLFPISENIVPILQNKLVLPTDSPFAKLEGGPGKMKFVIALSTDMIALQQFMKTGKVVNDDRKRPDYFWEKSEMKVSGKDFIAVQVELSQH